MTLDAGTLIAPLETERGDRYPGRPESVGRLGLLDAASAAQAQATSETRWAEGTGANSPLSLEGVYERYCLALARDPASIVGHVRGHDGIDTIVVDAALAELGLPKVLADGGGILLNSAERHDQALNHLCGVISVAWQARVGAVALFGSEPTRVLSGRFARTCIIPINNSVIVHPDSGGPFDVVPGRTATVEGFPRLLAGPDSLTILIHEAAWTSWVRKSMLEERARFHPLLRLDSPVLWNEPVECYGVPDRVRYLEVIQAEIESLVDNSPDELLRWWWLLDHHLHPLTLPANKEVISVRGRFPGGVGIIPHQEHLIVRGGGTNFLVPQEHELFLTDLVSGAPVDCDEASGRLACARVLASAGVVEPAPSSEGT